MNRAVSNIKDITMPFYGFNRPGAKVSEGIRENWWRQGMMGAIKAQYECVRVLSETEFFDDLKIIDVPVLVMHGEDDQICPFPNYRSTVGQTSEARDAQILSGSPPRHAHHACRANQRGPT